MIQNNHKKLLGYLLVQRVILFLAFYHVALSRKINMDDPDMGIWEYDYDKNGNLTRQKDAKGQEIHFQYDGTNLIRQKDYGKRRTGRS